MENNVSEIMENEVMEVIPEVVPEATGEPGGEI